ncbi:MAG: hypothetical protein PVG85_07585 [Deltaproteobacteria bacterium]|jgi:hypothetical protein
MADIMDMNIPLGQGTGIRKIDRAKQQTLKHKRPPPGRRPKEKEEKKKEPPNRFAETQEREDCNTDAENKQADKAFQPRGSILDVTI